MATDDRRRDYINATYQLIERDGLDSITIRKVANELGMTSGALYKHFDNLDTLLTYSTIRFLSDYAADARTLASIEMDPMQLGFQLWECMAYYAFRNIPVFEFIFFKSGGVPVRDVMFDYYHLFPEELAESQEYVASFMANDDISERSFIVLSRAAEQGMIDIADARFLSELEAFLFQGALAAYRNTYTQPGVSTEATQKFLNLLAKCYNSQMKDGHTLLVVSSSAHQAGPRNNSASTPSILLEQD